jgi:hypothetical protein
MCCDCVSSTVCQKDPYQSPEAGTLVFDACVCQAAVCGTICVGACAGQGIDQGCQACATQAASSQCATQLKGCPINN